jgi:hypothetical protein
MIQIAEIKKKSNINQNSIGSILISYEGCILTYPVIDCVRYLLSKKSILTTRFKKF